MVWPFRLGVSGAALATGMVSHLFYYTLYTILYTVYSILYTLILYTLYSILYTLYSIHQTYQGEAALGHNEDDLSATESKRANGRSARKRTKHRTLKRDNCIYNFNATFTFTRHVIRYATSAASDTPFPSPCIHPPLYHRPT